MIGKRNDMHKGENAKRARRKQKENNGNHTRGGGGGQVVKMCCCDLVVYLSSKYSPPQWDMRTISVSVVNVPLSRAHPLTTIVSPLSTQPESHHHQHTKSSRRSKAQNFEWGRKKREKEKTKEKRPQMNNETQRLNIDRRHSIPSNSNSIDSSCNRPFRPTAP